MEAVSGVSQPVERRPVAVAPIVQVREFILQGLDVRQMARLLGRPYRTVRGYVAKALHVEGVSSMRELQARELDAMREQLSELQRGPASHRQ